MKRISFTVEDDEENSAIEAAAEIGEDVSSENIANE